MYPVIEFSAVSKRFGQQTAVDQLSLTVPAGSIFALLGENGAGKSTTVRMLMGLVAPDSGSIRVLNLDAQRESLRVRQEVGYVPERPTLYDWMTVDEIGWFTAGFYTTEYLNRYRAQTLAFGLPPKRRVKDLSKGMRAKVSLSLALAKDPQLLVLDEPTSGLDTLVRREFLDSMVDRAAEGRTVVLSSHQISEVERVADYIAILKQGRLVVVDRLEKLKADVTEFTVSYTSAQYEPVRVSAPVLSHRSRGRQTLLLVRGDAAETRAELLAWPGIELVEQRTPTLEEIYVGLLRPSLTATATAQFTELPGLQSGGGD